MRKEMIPEKWRWFDEARYGLFIHWGPYAEYGRGEQALNREHLDQQAYAEAACRWNPAHFDPKVWADTARRGGMKYAVLTTRHHDGYCLWDTALTDYSSIRQAPKRDFIAEYVEAFRAAGLRVGLYYSFLDFRIPAYFDDPVKDPEGWRGIKDYIYGQVREILTNYGKIDVIWFDGLWPRKAVDLDSRALIAMIRELQPDILINDRLEYPQHSHFWQMPHHPQVPKEEELGDFGTPEQGIYGSPDHLWESCQTSTVRLWGYAPGERWRPAEEILETLVKCASGEGNFLLNVGPAPDGQFPPEFVGLALRIGQWLDYHGEAVYGCDRGDVTEFVLRGWQLVKGNNLYLVLRNWDGRPTLRVVDLLTPVKRATLMASEQELRFEQHGEELLIHGLPPQPPTDLYGVIRLECAGKPAGGFWAKNRTWGKDASAFRAWAAARGTSVWADGKAR